MTTPAPHSDLYLQAWHDYADQHLDAEEAFRLKERLKIAQAARVFAEEKQSIGDALLLAVCGMTSRRRADW